MPSRAVLVIPCYNEMSRLDRDEFTRFLLAEPRIDLIFVNDGSTDGTSAMLDEIQLAHVSRVTALNLPTNRGKAEAVRQGVMSGLAGAWDYVGYWDADLSTPLHVSSHWVDVLDERREIDWLFGARIRLLGRSIERKTARHIAGRLFATAASMTLGLPVYDTQCGAKLFRRTDAATALFSGPFLSRWVFDVEVLARVLADHRSSPSGRPFPVCEMPLQQWRDVGGSRLGVTHMLRAGIDLIRIAVSMRVRARRAMKRSVLAVNPIH
jgi:dolichyl-phosphate beta-glucosyltransferase